MPYHWIRYGVDMDVEDPDTLYGFVRFTLKEVQAENFPDELKRKLKDLGESMLAARYIKDEDSPD